MGTTFDLTGKTAIVTGAGKGIGRSIALGLANAGARVMLAARTEAELEAVADEIRSAGGEARVRVTDISQSDEVDGLVSDTVEAFGGVDIVINNAARSIMRPLLDLREDGFEKIFDTNVKGTFLVSRAAARVMVERGGGRIVNVTTIGAERGGPFIGVYHASKAAVKMLTMCMAAEWSPHNVLVNAVGPGLTRTEFSRPIWSNSEIEKAVTDRVPMGRIAEPEEIVGAVLFLCSEESAFITGQSLYVDGGALAAS